VSALCNSGDHGWAKSAEPESPDEVPGALAWHKRHAVMLAAQLPEELKDARLVLEALAELLDTFFEEAGDNAPELGSNVLSLVPR